MGGALQMYVQDHDHRYPYWVNPYDPSLDQAVGAANTRYWWAKLQPYYPVNWTNAAYHCPGYNGLIAGEESPRPPFGSYAYNARGVRGRRCGITTTNLIRSYGSPIDPPLLLRMPQQYAK
jgi:hypothetical protein